MGDWSNNTLRAALSAFTHKMNDATFSIVEISTLTGEASVSIRKGKKIISFDYNIVLKWQCILADSDGQQISKVEGKYELPEVANDTEWEDWECRVEYGEDPDNLRQCLDQLIRTFAPKALKKCIITEFVEQIKLK